MTGVLIAIACILVVPIVLVALAAVVMLNWPMLH